MWDFAPQNFSPFISYPFEIKLYQIFLFFQNSNILSAVLCLIKELDAPSLEVAEMAIRCRMEELDD